jgi:DNA-binding winged helix-turn-helix (wHTH) protein
MRLRFEDCEVDLARQELRRGGDAVEVQPKVFALLAELLRQRERVVGKAELRAALWPGEAVTEASLTSAVRALREALGDDGGSQRAIRTFRGRGYRFVAQVEELPGEERPADPDAYVGREASLALARAALDRARAGRAQALVLAGEPGIGKTRTAEELAATAAAQGARVCTARCTAADGAPALWPWVQLARALAPGSADPPSDLLRHDAASPASAQERFALFEAVAAWLRGVAAARPLVLVLDDLHEASRTSLELLRFLVSELHHAPVLFLCTCRDAALAGDPARSELLADLTRADPSSALELAGLSEAEVARLVALRTGRSPSRDFAAALREQTGGNPLFLIQILRLLEAEGRLDAALAGGAPAAALPRAVRAAVARRVQAHSARCHEVLVAASVIGREFSLRALAAVTGSERSALLDALGEAIGARLVEEVPGRLGHYRFAHAVVRDTLYGELAPARRGELHGRAGAHLAAVHAADLSAPLSEIASHFVAAAPAADTEVAVAWTRRAAREAAAAGSFAEAVAQGRRALAVLDLADPSDDRLRCEILIELGEAELRAGDGAAQATLRRGAHLARQRGWPDLLARAALGSEDFARRRADGAAVAQLEEALAVVGTQDPALRVRLLSRLAEASQGDAESAEARSAEATALARQLGDPGLLAVALAASRTAGFEPARLSERRELDREIARLAEAAGERELGLEARLWCAADALEALDLAGVEREVAAFETGVRAAPHHAGRAQALRAMRSLLAGRLAEGDALARAALEAGARAPAATSPTPAEIAFAHQISTRGLLDGELAEAVSALRALVEARPDAASLRAALAHALAASGCEAEARAELDRLGHDGFRGLPRDDGWIAALASLAETCAALGDVARAAPLYDLLAPCAGRAVVVGLASACRGSLDRPLGLLAATLSRFDLAERHFAAAADANARLGARPYAAWVDHDHARLLLARGRPAERARARALAARAEAAARALGLRPLVAGARELQRGLAGVTRLPPRRRP